MKRSLKLAGYLVELRNGGLVSPPGTRITPSLRVLPHVTVPDTVCQQISRLHELAIAAVLRDHVLNHPPRLDGTMIVLDNGKRVVVEDTSDCCAYAEVLEFLFNADKVDHVITDVSLNSGGYEINIVADMDDVLALRIRWSEGSGWGYSFGFKIKVKELNPEWVKFEEEERALLAELRAMGVEI